jgi:hypothetical protein
VRVLLKVRAGIRGPSCTNLYSEVVAGDP